MIPMTVRELIDALKELPPDDHVLIARWTGEQTLFADCAIACNIDHQVENHYVGLIASQGVEYPSPAELRG